MEFFRQLFGPGDFMPHGYCYLWNPGLVWLHVVSDSLIALSYFSIPFTLLWFVRKRRDLPFGFVFILFGTFIVACGSTHVLEVWNLWHSQYWLAGFLKAITAIASVSTAIVVARLLPQALDGPSPADWKAANTALENEIQERREMEISLRSAAAMSRAPSDLLELIHDAIFVRDFQSKIIFWNQSAERLYGWKKDEVGERTAHDLLQSKFPYALEQIEAAVLAKGYWEGELQHQTRDGRTVTVSSSAIRDLTERKKFESRLQETEQRFRILVEGIKDYAIVALDPQGTISSWNTGAERIKGYAASEIIGKHISCFYRPEDVAKNIPDELLRRAADEGVTEQEGWRVRKDGTQFWADVVITALRDDAGKLLGFAKITRDVTERRNLEQELRNANEFLEHRVSERTLELAAANTQLRSRQSEVSALNASLEARVLERTAELVRTNSELEAFSYSVSHDLRTPLRHVDGFARILKEEFVAELPAEGHRFLERILAATTHMGHQIDDLLSLARIGRKEIQRMDAPMDELVKQALADLPLEEQRAIEWRIHVLPKLNCEPGLIKLAFTNLLSNASKFTRTRPAALIEVGSCLSDGIFTLFVRDNGVGFDPKYADKLFGVFQRLHRQEDFEGTGIGLATVQRIVHRHGGRIWAESSPGNGATFFFTLDSQSQPAEPRETAEIKHG
jgi:PAS domain S-box-containing protein